MTERGRQEKERTVGKGSGGGMWKWEQKLEMFRETVMTGSPVGHTLKRE